MGAAQGASEMLLGADGPPGAWVLLQVVPRGSGQGWCIRPSGHRALVVHGVTGAAPGCKGSAVKLLELPPTNEQRGRKAPSCPAASECWDPLGCTLTASVASGELK